MWQYIGGMAHTKEETEVYKKAVKHLVLGGSKKYRQASETKNDDDGLTKSPFTLTGKVKFDIEKNELGFETEGVQGGTYSLLVRFSEQKVYHAHRSPHDPRFQSAIYDIRIEDKNE